MRRLYLALAVGVSACAGNQQVGLGRAALEERVSEHEVSYYYRELKKTGRIPSYETPQGHVSLHTGARRQKGLEFLPRFALAVDTAGATVSAGLDTNFDGVIDEVVGRFPEEARDAAIQVMQVYADRELKLAGQDGFICRMDGKVIFLPKIGLTYGRYGKLYMPDVGK
ncbi:MAG: hypothetical protein ABH879_07020 [archaeon]